MDKIILTRSEVFDIVKNGPGGTRSQTARLKFEEAAAGLINPEPDGINGHFVFDEDGKTIRLRRILFQEHILRSVFSTQVVFSSFLFEHCDFEAEENVDSIPNSLKIKNLRFLNCSFSEKLLFKDQEVEGALHFLDCTMKEGVLIQECGFDSLNISGNGFQDRSKITGIKVVSTRGTGQCELKYISLNGSLILEGPSFIRDICIQGVEAESIQIRMDENFGRSLTVLDCKTIQTLLLSGTNKMSSIKIENSFQSLDRFIRVLFSDFKNESTVEISHLKELQKISAFHAQLGKITFQEIDLRNVKLEYANSTSNQVILENCKLPHYRKLPRHDLVALYQGLKVAARHQGSRLNELLFTYAEKESFRQEIKQNSERKKDVPWTDRVVLQISHYVNEHGMDWMKPLLLLLGSCLIWYGAILLVMMFSDAPCNCSPARILNTLQFALPTHRLENVFRPLSDGAYPPLAWVFDTLSRVTSSFFIYEIIAAFRKYSKF